MKPVLFSLAVVLAVLCAQPRAAEARGIVIINTGDDIMYLHAMPQAAIDAMPDLAGYKVGYKYSLFGVFWLDIWRWDGELVIYQGNTYEPVPDEARELIGGETPIGYRLPPGLLAILCGVAVALVSTLKRKRGVMLGMTVAFAGATAGLWFGKLGISCVIPAAATCAVLFIALTPPPREPVSFREPDAQP